MVNMNLGAIMKMAKGSADPEALRAILGAMGVDLEMKPVLLHDAPGELRQVATAAGKRGASLHRLRGRMKDGSALEAFIVFAPATLTDVTAVTEPASLVA